MNEIRIHLEQDRDDETTWNLSFVVGARVTSTIALSLKELADMAEQLNGFLEHNHDDGF